jgi:hypothetical protein
MRNLFVVSILSPELDAPEVTAAIQKRVGFALAGAFPHCFVDLENLTSSQAFSETSPAHSLFENRGKLTSMTMGELLSEIGKGQLLAASPRQCFLLDREGRITLEIDPALCRRLIVEANYRLTWLSQNTWTDGGRVGWRDLVPAGVADNYARIGLDFFSLTQ